ncbi:unnamed protein product [Cylicocyclus nassatus]|uniref:Uncharacterized protein n=1 Tax=Cylicocyclus nassatus TaxID=53992 RepID=A0AA36MDQ2_CYLNA|nr:unnamed protein product [Cylicocyclus nassatus]
MIDCPVPRTVLDFQLELHKSLLQAQAVWRLIDAKCSLATSILEKGVHQGRLFKNKLRKTYSVQNQIEVNAALVKVFFSFSLDPGVSELIGLFRLFRKYVLAKVYLSQDEKDFQESQADYNFGEVPRTST